MYLSCCWAYLLSQLIILRRNESFCLNYLRVVAEAFDGLSGLVHMQAWTRDFVRILLWPNQQWILEACQCSPRHRAAALAVFVCFPGRWHEMRRRHVHVAFSKLGESLVCRRPSVNNADLPHRRGGGRPRDTETCFRTATA